MLSVPDAVRNARATYPALRNRDDNTRIRTKRACGPLEVKKGETTDSIGKREREKEAEEEEKEKEEIEEKGPDSASKRPDSEPKRNKLLHELVAVVLLFPPSALPLSLPSFSLFLSLHSFSEDGCHPAVSRRVCGPPSRHKDSYLTQCPLPLRRYAFERDP